MSIEKDGTFIASCDFCSETIDTETDDFHDAVAIMKREGWKIFKGKRQEWQHKCPACVEDEAEGDFECV